MRANPTIYLASAIAIPTKKPDRVWISVPLQPKGNVASVQFVAVKRPISGYVIECKERPFGLSATFTLAAVMLYRSLPTLFSPSAYGLPILHSAGFAVLVIFGVGMLAASATKANRKPSRYLSGAIRPPVFPILLL